MLDPIMDLEAGGRRRWPGVQTMAGIQRVVAGLPGPQGLWTSLAVAGATAVFWYVFLRRAPGGGGGGADGTAGDARGRRRMAAPPGDTCTEEEWGPLFQSSLHGALMQLRDMHHAGLLFIIIEGAADDAATQRLRQWVWPDAAVREYLQAHTGADGSPAQVMPVRLADGSDDAKLILEVFKQRRDKLPLFLFLWGKPQARLM